jgi:hypothetical protein
MIGHIVRIGYSEFLGLTRLGWSLYQEILTSLGAFGDPKELSLLNEIDLRDKEGRHVFAKNQREHLYLDIDVCYKVHVFLHPQHKTE